MKSNIKIPTTDECHAIIKEHNMLPNIIAHSEQVMNIGAALTDNLITGTDINRDLIIAASLLHDIAKTRTIQSGELRHDLLGGDIVRALGYDEVAEIIESHVFFKNFSADTEIEEKEIVYYADKRVMHDRIVSIDERIDDIVKRYAITEEIKNRIVENKKFISRLENKIQTFLIRDINEIISEL